MSTLEEIDATYNALKDNCNELSLLNCVSEYPPVYEDINLNVINVMQKRYPEATIGHSDHTPDLYTCFAATALGAKIIEKHFTLNKKIKGPDISCSMDKRELKDLIQFSNKMTMIFQKKDDLLKEENVTRNFAFHSVVSNRDILKGEKFDKNNLTVKRPGIGYFPANKITNTPLYIICVSTLVL